VSWHRPLTVLAALAVTACGDGGSTTPAVPTSISVTPATVRFDALGETQQLTATVHDQNGDVLNNASLSWTSSNTRAVSVSSTGLVTATSAGSATITATSGSESGRASVLVNQAVAGMSLSPTNSLDLAGAGDTATVVVSITDARGSAIPDPTITWSSDDEGVASVDDEGLVTATGSGSTTLTVDAEAGGTAISSSLVVTVDDGVLAGSGGGEVSVAEGAATLEVPAGAISGRVFVTAREATGLPAGAVPIAAFDLGPDGLVFTQPVTLTIAYDPANLPPGGSEADLRLYKLVGSGFVLVDGSTVDEVNNTVAGQISGFSVYAVLEQLSVSGEALPEGVVGAPYDHTLAVSGGSGSYTWSVASGSLSAGLSLSSAGVISGTPTGAGTSDFTVQVVSGGQMAQRVFSIAVSDLLSVTSSVLPSGVVGSAYEAGLSATGGDGNDEWTVVAGELPPGLELDVATGVIAGTPTSPGPSNFTVRVTSGVQEAERALSIAIYTALEVLTSSLPNGAPEIPYEATLQATGGDGAYTWSVSSGSLPGGLSLTASTGVISGIPSASGSTFTIQVESGDGQTDTQGLTIDVHAELAVFTTLLPDGSIGVEYSETLVATGGDGDYEWEVVAGSLPSGIGLAVNGTIAGTPSVGGTSDFTVEVSSGGQTAQRELSIVVHAQLTVTTTSLPDAARSEPYSQNLTATGGNGSYSWTVVSGSLPDGLALSAGGNINGTPTGVGASNFTVEVTDGTQTAQKPLSMSVTGPPETVTDLIVVDQTSTTLTVRFTEVDDGLGGPADYALRHAVSPIEWGSADASQEIVQGTQVGAQRQVIVTGLAPDTQYDVQMVAFRGTPDVDAVYSENLSNVATGTTLVAPVVLTTSYLVGGYPNTFYSDQIGPAAGGNGTYLYSVTDGALPAGLSLNPSTGAISGTTAGTGLSVFEITATSAGLSASAIYSITVSNEPPGAFNLWAVSIPADIPTSKVRGAVNSALARWEATVVGNRGSVTIPSSVSGFCNSGDDLTGLLNGALVDDVLVLVDIRPIDGLGNTVAQAGPCIGFQSAPQTIVGRLTLDAEDLEAFSEAQAQETVWHEIGHIMGIGTLWGSLLSGNNTADPRFLGLAANAEYFALGGTLSSIPVEEGGGPGTAYGHWDEGWFDTEAMTGYLEIGVEPISRMTIASLADIGWSVSYAAADFYSLPGCSPLCNSVISQGPAGLSAPPRGFERPPDWEIGLIPDRR
jgi:hypothetical protein